MKFFFLFLVNTNKKKKKVTFHLDTSGNELCCVIGESEASSKILDDKSNNK